VGVIGSADLDATLPFPFVAPFNLDLAVSFSIGGCLRVNGIISCSTVSPSIENDEDDCLSTGSSSSVELLCP
jgi:hypothetical protein